jgi:hypothetical protein
MISGKMVEVEQAKVKVMATALVHALAEAGVPEDQRKAATRAFLDQLRTVQAEAIEPPLPTEAYNGTVLHLAPADEDLL